MGMREGDGDGDDDCQFLVLLWSHLKGERLHIYIYK